MELLVYVIKHFSVNNGRKRIIALELMGKKATLKCNNKIKG